MSKFGENILITGANRGIGLALIQQLVQTDGIKHLFACCRNPDGAKDLIELQKTHTNVIPIKLDVQDDQTIQQAYEQVTNILGTDSLNLLINNAGVNEEDGGSCDNPDRTAFQKSFDINSNGVVMVTAKFLPFVQKAADHKQRAMVANVSSEIGSSGRAYKCDFNNVCYGMSKAALNYYTKMLSEYFKDSGIIFVAFSPGWVRTDMGGPDANLSPEESTSAVLKTLAGLTIEDSGRYMNRYGETVPY
uniref:Uncharacterized protein n=1 Tax=Acrobeloides nanus TaxID=290746 RepID=A0A914BUW7_9BILA